jgi:hypothetical protein
VGLWTVSSSIGRLGGMPYVAQLDENMILSQACLAMAARRFIPPNTLFEKYSIGSTIDSPKNIRRCRDIELTDVSFTNGPETLWFCDDIRMKNVYARGDYFAMNCSNIKADRLELVGKYSFDDVKNVEIHDSRLMTKDAFWNSENVTVYDSFISAEYLGWNSKNLTFINCTIESLQGLCYVENLVMRNCRTLNTTLAFEYSTCDVEVKGHIDSIKNPKGGVIRADSIGEVIMEDNRVDTSNTIIETGKV